MGGCTLHTHNLMLEQPYLKVHGEALLDDGWRVGFLPEGGVNADNARYLVEDGVPTLWVLDYVATRSQEVETILQAMAGDRAGRRPRGRGEVQPHGK